MIVMAVTGIVVVVVLMVVVVAMVVVVVMVISMALGGIVGNGSVDSRRNAVEPRRTRGNSKEQERTQRNAVCSRTDCSSLASLAHLLVM